MFGSPRQPTFDFFGIFRKRGRRRNFVVKGNPRNQRGGVVPVRGTAAVVHLPHPLHINATGDICPPLTGCLFDANNLPLPRPARLHQVVVNNDDLGGRDPAFAVNVLQDDRCCREPASRSSINNAMPHSPPETSPDNGCGIGRWPKGLMPGPGAPRWSWTSALSCSPNSGEILLYMDQLNSMPSGRLKFKLAKETLFFRWNSRKTGSAV